MNTRSYVRLGLGAALFSLSACGAYAVPAEHVTNARDTIRAAGAAGAAESTQGRRYLLTAQAEFEKAMHSSGKQADLLLLRSQVDAELARALTREDALRSQALEAMRRARSLSSSQPRP